MSREINKILVGNRGEIALRVLRACRERGIRSVAVYSDVDRASLHVAYADEAYRLGPAPASESYLRGDIILQIARDCGADAIHPGYGFLSENPDFAGACEASGIIFIGPPSGAMRMLGSKTRARQTADSVSLPRVPGSTHALESLEDARKVASAVGYPIMLKAAAGGGGKGMRAVQSEAELSAAFENARSEAERAFGSGEVYIEKLIARPRHIEIQLLADQHGSCVYLGERECSVQRRHQKVVEEAPSAIVDSDLRDRMGAAAVRLALAAGYTNAGTAEFLVDAERNFYFLEMNTRIQVEHPVTEAVTGIDLVQLQLTIAAGKELPYQQSDIKFSNHAIECRINAESAKRSFHPSPGRITKWAPPQDYNIRLDTHCFQDYVVPPFYDSLLAKLIVSGTTRSDAIDNTHNALRHFQIDGIETNLDFLTYLSSHPDFIANTHDTRWIENNLDPFLAQ